ncbi:methyltransferase [Cellulophaga sp. E16_2]|uniref:Polypeptide chain release factor methylase n=1 Tax=Cellulophaga algicola (strain DSM 14237 / IC166 / ACAM 630) TaxID=688270 RepID=E6X5G1_CELAD|nr:MULTISPECIES: methyltransferase [Cellulophaga]ADV50516.1 polypeptide chain release factor methylase [Cellulophaga algicola DSM 14237]MBO0592946.1 methyltransferase [Cellulophaga sp. E16_2]
MSTDIKLSKPQPIILDKQLEMFNRGSDVNLTIKALEAGKPVLITAFYSNGLVLLKELKYYLQKKFPNDSFQEQRKFRAAYQKLSNLILIEIVANKLIVKKAPSIGWLEKLYPEISDFLLPFPQVQGLNSAWQWYENGIAVPVLRNKMHPYYGVYFPTRFDHLILFDQWLKRYEGPKKSATDIGIGSGILSLQMVKYGFQKVFGTDTNPNSIIGLTEFMGDTKLSRKIALDHGSLFGKFEKQTELIVFNPPWLPQAHDLDRIDEAIYYTKDLFPEFFAAAKKHLLPEGKLVVLFSNLGQITNATKEHPIAMELANGGRFKLEKCHKKSVKVASDKTKRDQHWRTLEEVELWVLTH